MLIIPTAIVVLMCAPDVREALAHEMRPSLLSLEERSGGEVFVDWRLGFAKGAPLPLTLSLEPECPRAAPPEVRFQPPVKRSRWVWRCDGGLGGRRLSLVGLKRSGTDVILRVSRADRVALESFVLTADAPTMVFSSELSGPGPAASARGGLWAYAELGAGHILEGNDHLLFVLGLWLLVWQSRAGWRPRGRALCGAVTGFTLGHSLTLGLASLKWVEAGGHAVEALIALSVLLLFRELALGVDVDPPEEQGAAQASMARRHPWVFAAACGLLHGLGFAGALAEIGLPDDARLIALIGFNLGVEFGQLIFIGAVLLGVAAASWAFHRLGDRAMVFGARLWKWTVTALVMGLGVVSGSWFMGRLWEMLWSL